MNHLKKREKIITSESDIISGVANLFEQTRKDFNDKGNFDNQPKLDSLEDETYEVEFDRHYSEINVAEIALMGGSYSLIRYFLHPSSANPRIVGAIVASACVGAIFIFGKGIDDWTMYQMDQIKSKLNAFRRDNGLPVYSDSVNETARKRKEAEKTLKKMKTWKK